MRLLKALVLFVACVFVLFIGWTFATLNTDLVKIDLLFVTLPEASLSVWLMASFVLGGIAGVVISSVLVMTLKVRLGAARRKIDVANKELDQLRTASLKHSA